MEGKQSPQINVFVSLSRQLTFIETLLITAGSLTTPCDALLVNGIPPLISATLRVRRQREAPPPH